jgi:cell division protein FtsB
VERRPLSRKVYAHSQRANDAPKPFRAAKEVRTAAVTKPKRAARPKTVKAPKAPSASKPPKPPKEPKPSGARLRRPLGAPLAAFSGRRAARPTERAQRRPPSTTAPRRSRIPVALAGAFALVLLMTSFPLTSLLSQRHQISADRAELAQLNHEDSLLGEQEGALNSKTEIDRLARQDYQLVSPGQTLYQVLPPSGSSSSATTLPGGIGAGDPGNRAPVAPSQAPDMSPDPGLPKAPAGSTVAVAGSNSGSDATQSHSVTGPSTFWGRVANTLEFWS